MEYVPYINLAATVVVLVTIISVWIDMKRTLGKLQAGPVAGNMVHIHNAGGISTVAAGGYTLWAYRQGAWQLERDRSEPGFACGLPPARTGWYEGEVVRTGSVGVPSGSPEETSISTTA